jgi:hypothetical protein
MFLPLFFIQILFGCGEEVDTGPQFKVDPVNLPIEVEKVVIFPNQDVSTDSYLQCLPTISGADTTTMEISYIWKTPNEEILGDQYYLQLSSDLVRSGDTVICQVSVIDGTGDSGENQADVLVERAIWHMEDMEYAFLGERPGDALGTHIASIGDSSGDGDDDFLLSAPKSDRNYVEAGAVYLFQNMEGDTENAHAIIEGIRIKDHLGQGSYAGDLDGDGLNDIILSSPDNDENGVESGTVYIFYASTLIDGGLFYASQADRILYGSDQKEHFGTKIFGLDDLNDDGYGELIVGIPDSKGNGSASGRVEIYSGRNLLDENTDPLFIMEGDGAQSNLGGNFASFPDLDGDERQEFWVVASGGTTKEAKMYLFLGVQLNQEELSLEDAFAVIRSESLGDGSMTSLSTGDLDDDGYGDIVIGSPYDSEVAYNTGKISIIMGDQLINGGEIFLSDAYASILGEEVDDNAGTAVRILNDSDENGARELFVSAPGSSQKSIQTGKAYVIPSDMYMSGGVSSLNSINIGLYGEISYDRLGEQIATVKDINRDGFWDVLLSAPSSNTNGSDAGKVYFVSLGDL